MKDIANQTDEVGYVLTSNMLAGFALELCLKLFYMTYNEEGPPRGHHLSALYAGLPDTIKKDIATAYLATNNGKALIRVFGLRHSPETPAVPATTLGHRYDSADAFFTSADDCFVRSRYLFEEVNGEDWTLVDHPLSCFASMIDVVVGVYQGYRASGGFGAGGPVAPG